MPIDTRTLLIGAFAAMLPLAALAAEQAAPASDDAKAEQPAHKGKRPARAAVSQLQARAARKCWISLKSTRRTWQRC